MASLNLVCIQAGGGIDGINFVSPRDVGTGTVASPQVGSSVEIIRNRRQGAPSNVLDYSEALTKVSSMTTGSTVVNVASTTGIVEGMLVYSRSLPAIRNLTVASIGTNQIVLSEPAYATATNETVTFATAEQLLKVNESGTRNLGLHYTQKMLWDGLNVVDDITNINKPKAALVCSIGPLRKPLQIISGGNVVLRGSLAPVTPNDVPERLESHNDQTSTVQSNSAEGATKGWGGGIADSYVSSLSTDNQPLAVVSASNLPVFCAGTTAQAFSISANGLISPLPNTLGLASYDSDVPTNTAYETLLLQAAQAVAPNDNIGQSANLTSKLAIDYQTILADAMEITDIPSNLFFNISGSDSVSATTFLRNCKQTLRMIFVNNPTRGVTCTRSGNTVTVSTEVSTGVANRVAGSSTIEITCTNHRLFTSNTGPNETDSVIVLTSGATIDTSNPSSGYKITLSPSDVNNKFTFSSSATTELVNVPVTVRLKHNLGTFNKVFFEEAGFDTPTNPNGYQVQSVINLTQFTVTTSASGAYPSTTLSTKAKLVNLPKQVFYLEPAINFDSHTHANHSHLAAINAALAWFVPIASRMVDANIVTFINTEFGRTLSTNTAGTDHGWANNFWVIGNPVRKGVYGDIMEYNLGGKHVTPGQGGLMPTTSIYQYGYTFAKWMGLSDAQSLALFPDLINWDLSERNLGFLNPLV